MGIFGTSGGPPYKELKEELIKQQMASISNQNVTLFPGSISSQLSAVPYNSYAPTPGWIIIDLIGPEAEQLRYKLKDYQGYNFNGEFLTITDEDGNIKLVKLSLIKLISMEPC